MQWSLRESETTSLKERSDWVIRERDTFNSSLQESARTARRRERSDCVNRKRDSVLEHAREREDCRRASLREFEKGVTASTERAVQWSLWQDCERASLRECEKGVNASTEREAVESV